MIASLNHLTAGFTLMRIGEQQSANFDRSPLLSYASKIIKHWQPLSAHEDNSPKLRNEKALQSHQID